MLFKNLFTKNYVPLLLQQTRTYPRGSRFGLPVRQAEPGIARQREMLDNFQDYLNDPEGIGDQEADFTKLHKMYDDFERDSTFNDDKIRQSIIKQKYFKEKHVNFLTWTEKDQMRSLHAKDPDTYTIEHLSNSFPATPDIVAKVITAKWYPNDVKRVEKHDEAVKRSWEAFRKNEIDDLSPELVKHLKRFSDRKIHNTADSISLKAITANQFQFPKPKRTEFASIITSCKPKPKESETKAIEEAKQPAAPAIGESMSLSAAPANDKDSFMLSEIKDRKLYKFEDIVRKKKLKAAQPKEEEPVSMSPFQNDDSFATITLTTEDVDVDVLKAQDVAPSPKPNEPVQKYQESIGSVHQQRRQPMAIANTVQERIKIPKELRKKNATYQFKDCFYDSRGSLMYRVPGLMPHHKY